MCTALCSVAVGALETHAATARVVESVSCPELGYDGAKPVAGRKRHPLVDANGLVLARVYSADPLGPDGGKRLLGEGQELPRLELFWDDGAYTDRFCE
jgi:hypothetical protein